MNCNFFLKKHTDTLIEQTKTKSQETLEFQLHKQQLQTFSFSPPFSLVEEAKWLLARTKFEATNSVFNISNENTSFSIITPRHWSSRGGAEPIHKLQKLLELKSEKDIEFFVKETGKRGKHIKIGDKEENLSDFSSRKNQINENLKNSAM